MIMVVILMDVVYNKNVITQHKNSYKSVKEDSYGTADFK